MNDLPRSREECMHRIREAAGEDIWITRFLLVRALQELDLGRLNGLLEDAEGVAQWPQFSSDGLLKRLVAERWG